MVLDITQTALAFVLFIPLLLVPGLVAGWLTDAADFRTAGVPARLLLAGPLSVAVVPIFAYLTARLGGFALTWIGLGAVWIVFLALAPRILPRQGLGDLAAAARKPVAWAAILPWLVGGLFMLLDLELGNGLSMSTLIVDKYSHVGVADAIARTGVPPANPFFSPGTPLPLYYYYFWFLLCSLVDQAGGTLIDARQAVTAANLWGGLVFMAGLLVFLRHLAQRQIVPPAYGVALFLILVSGIDILPLAILAIISGRTGIGPGLGPDLEWWNEQVTAWPSAMLWVPHHASVLALFLVLLVVLRRLADAPPKGKQAVAGPLTVVALGLASAVGTSVWVTFVGVAVWGTWTVACLAGRRRREAALFIVPGIVALALALPFLIDLAAANQRPTLPLVVAVRDFWWIEDLATALGGHYYCDKPCRTVAMPFSYAVEFGFYALAAGIYWMWRCRQGRLGLDERLVVVMAAAALAVSSFLAANVDHNDLGWRGIMFVQVAVLVWSLPIAHAVLPVRPVGLTVRPGRVAGLLLAVAVVLGVMTTAAGLLRLRIWPASEENLALRDTYRWLDRHVPREAIIQHNPDVLFEPFSSLYGHRQLAIIDPYVGPLFGIDSERMWEAHDDIAWAFLDGVPAAEALQVARDYRIDYLVARPTDSAWEDPSSWLYRVRPRFETPYSRVIAVADLEAALK
jgi:hypothetical protein